jgi:Rrf2 family protein
MHLGMKLSSEVLYALGAMLRLAKLAEQKPVPASRLAIDGQISQPFLQQILRTLQTHGLLHSTRGVKGGYALARPTDQTSLLEVIEAIEGPYNLRLDGCDGLTKDSQRKLHAALRDVTQTVRRKLESIKLSQLQNGAG